MTTVKIAQLGLPPVQQLERAGGAGDFVAQVVGPTAVGIDIVEMLMQAARQQPGNDIEVFVVVRGQPAGVVLRLRGRAASGRQMAADFEFDWRLHGQGGTAQGGAHLQLRVHGYGITAVFSSPFRCFICSNTCGNSCKETSPVTKSLARMEPRATASRAALMNRGV